MDVFFDITAEQVNSMSIEDYEALERAQDGEIRIYRLRPVLCRFMVTEENKPIPFDEALKITSKFGFKEFGEFASKFFAAMKEKAVPKASGSPSKLPSEVQ